MRFRGNQIVHNASSGGFGRQIQIDMDAGFQSCRAQVISAKAGRGVTSTRSVATGGTIEFESVSAGAANCSVRTGNAFAQ